MATQKLYNLTALGFVRVAAATPRLRVGDIEYNTARIVVLARRADKVGVQVAVFPELALTGYTLGDLFHNDTVHRGVARGIEAIRAASRTLRVVIVVGAPLRNGNAIFNAGIVIAQGRVRGAVPKTYIPGYKEFYEERWFASGRDALSDEVEIGGARVPFGTNLLFRAARMPEAVIGIELCEDLWVPIPPSSQHVLRGATLIANLSASNDLVGKSDYRRDLVVQQSARGICGYVYASAGVDESTTDVVFGGDALISENGTLRARNDRYARTDGLVIADIDIARLKRDRERMTSFAEGTHEAGVNKARIVEIPLAPLQRADLHRTIAPQPFVPSDTATRDERVREIFAIQSAGLAKRMEQAGFFKPIIGLSGGLDSTLALLVAVEACRLLNLPRMNIYAYTMPGFATSRRTKSNAVALAHALGVSLETIDITKGARRHLKDIGHDEKRHDVTFENTQARYRTMLLMSKANQIKGLVVGTGDLSEIALGWNTFTGDHISHYNVNASIPKTLVRHLVSWASEQEEFAAAAPVLRDIIETPISPELTRAASGEITQKTEDIIGPYELHDFFLYHLVRWGSAPKKILFLARHAFGKQYSDAALKKWLVVFISRFFKNQWKRSVMPDGPKVGSVSLSPRGDWRMPSDAEVALWLKELH